MYKSVMDLENGEYINRSERDVHIWAPAKYPKEYGGKARIIAGFCSKAAQVPFSDFLTWLEMLLVSDEDDFFEKYTIELHKCEDPTLQKPRTVSTVPPQNQIFRRQVWSGFDRKPKWEHCEIWFKKKTPGSSPSPYLARERYPSLRPLRIISRSVTAPPTAKVKTPYTPKTSDLVKDVGRLAVNDTTEKERKKKEDRNRNLRAAGRDRDELCMLTRIPAPPRARGQNWKGFHAAHLVPLEALKKENLVSGSLDHMRPADRIKWAQDYETGDQIHNVMMLRADVHALFDDYQWGVWNDKIYRFEENGALTIKEFIDGKTFQYSTKLLADPVQLEGFKVMLNEHFFTCLTWHVRGQGRTIKNEPA